MKTMFVAVALVVLVAAIPASAVASTQYYIPPGNSSANEYVESVPTAGGGSASGFPGVGGGTRPQHGGTAGAVSSSTRSALVHQGRDGVLTAAFATESAPAGPHITGAERAPEHASRNHAGGAVTTGTGAADSGSPVGSVLGALTGAGGATSSRVLLLILILVGLGTATVALRRRLAR
jgi:hypothetical protein